MKISTLFLCFASIYANHNEPMVFESAGILDQTSGGNAELKIVPNNFEDIVKGSTQTFICKIQGAEGQVWWRKEGEDITRNNGCNSKCTGILLIENATRKDTGNYTCVANTIGGQFLTEHIHIGVLEPGIVTVRRYEVNTKANKSVTLYCDVEGYPIKNFTWRRSRFESRSGNLENLTKIIRHNNTHVTMSLQLKNVTLKEHGGYECQAHDFRTRIFNFMYLIVKDVPHINIIETLPVGSSSVYLYWTIEDGNKPVSQLLIEYMKKEENEWKKYTGTTWEKMRGCVLSGLENGTTYQFRIIVSNSLGRSPAAHSNWITTFEKDVHFVPNVTVVATNSESITIRLSTPPLELNHPLAYHAISAKSSDKTEIKLRGFRVPLFGLGNLEPETNYQIRVATCNYYTDKCGAWSTEHEVVTKNRNIEFVPNCSVEATTHHSITIKWSVPPSELGDRVHQYKLMIQRGEGTMETIYKNETINSHVFRNLTSESTYWVNIAACSDYKTICGNPSAKQEVITKDRDPNFIPTLVVNGTTLQSITISWSTPAPGLEDRVHQWKLIAQPSGETVNPVFVHKTRNSHVFKNLSQKTEYLLKVAACSDYSTQCSNWSSSRKVITLDRDLKFIPNVSRVARTSNSITISWSKPVPDLESRVSQYKVRAKHREEEGEPVFVDKTENTYVFEDLKSESAYLLQVAACSDYRTQCGNWSTAVDGYTANEEIYETLSAANGTTQDWVWPSVAGVLILLIIIGAVWLIDRNRREKESRKRFMEETLEHINSRALGYLDPELNTGDEAELLRYIKKWEFPQKLLKFDKVLGSGAFGIVKKAQAKSICRNEEVTTVAVKLVRATHSLSHMTALKRELKILCCLGKHLNVVNLLGACTRNVSYGQLMVIVEFCRFGNLHDYLLRRRADFGKQNDTVTNDQDLMKSSTCSANPDATADHVGVETINWDVNSATELFRQSINSTELGTAGDSDVADLDEVELEQPSNYWGDYTDKDLEPICTQDLLCWAWQVARGMKYLGERRILHGDLATRNILLADNNVVKICDFGLAKALYADDNYKKRGNGPMPVKWMAIESLRDRVFSVNSDVWSYGIVLWEFFTLAETPYPGMPPETLCQRLIEGFRMAQPKYATEDIYRMMLRCWNAEPSQRPSFNDLSNSIADLLDEAAKMHYFDLDAPYVEINVETRSETLYSTTTPSEAILHTSEGLQD